MNSLGTNPRRVRAKLATRLCCKAFKLQHRVKSTKNLVSKQQQTIYCQKCRRMAFGSFIQPHSSGGCRVVVSKSFSSFFSLPLLSQVLARDATAPCPFARPWPVECANVFSLGSPSPKDFTLPSVRLVDKSTTRVMTESRRPSGPQAATWSATAVSPTFVNWSPSRRWCSTLRSPEWWPRMTFWSKSMCACNCA